MRKAALVLTIAPVLLGAGPISKFDDRPPDDEYESHRKMEDIERCLIDLNGQLAPQVYRQPDRLDDVLIVWPKAGTLAGIADAKVELRRLAGTTHVRSYLKTKQLFECAPRA